MEQLCKLMLHYRTQKACASLATALRPSPPCLTHAQTRLTELVSITALTDARFCVADLMRHETVPGQ